MAPLVWQETDDLRNAQGTRCERSEDPQEASAREGLRSRSDMYRVGLRLNAAVVHDLKDRVSYDDDDRNSGTTGEAGSGRCETWSRQVMQ